MNVKYQSAKPDMTHGVVSSSSSSVIFPYIITGPALNVGFVPSPAVRPERPNDLRQGRLSHQQQALCVQTVCLVYRY